MRSFQPRNGIVIDLAQPADDASLRVLLRDTPLPGDISITFGREPSFFQAVRVEGNDAYVIVGRTQENEIIGMGTRSEKYGYINGQLRCFGYLSGLRLKREYRSFSLLKRGFQLFKEIHARRDVKLYLATITQENVRAEKVLISGRGGLPCFKDYGELRTFALRPMSMEKTPERKPFVIRQAGERDIPALLRFLNENGLKRQFSPRYKVDDFTSGLLQGLKMADIFLAIKDEEIIGSLGFWDQSAYKQNIVHRYGGRLRNIRRVFNFYAFLTGRPLLPKENTALSIRTGAICCIRDDDKDVFRALLRHGLVQPRFSKMHSFILGFHEKDPLVTVVQESQHHLYRSRLYVIHWGEDEDVYRALDGRVPYVEIGGL